MRVLLVVHGYPPAASGGTEIYTQQLADALSELSGLAVFVLTRDCDSSRPEYSLRQEATATGVTVYRINNTFQACSSFEDSYTNPALASVAARIIDQEIDPDVIHIQHLTCLSTEIVKHASAARRPVAMTLNDYWLLCHRGQLLRPDGTRCDGPFDGGCASCVPAVAEHDNLVVVRSMSKGYCCGGLRVGFMNRPPDKAVARPPAERRHTVVHMNEA
jgi:hypothetical protein